MSEYWQRLSDIERAKDAAREARERLRAPPGAVRDQAIVSMLDAGHSAAVVGDMYGLTPERIHQIKNAVRHAANMAKLTVARNDPRSTRAAVEQSWRTPEDEWRAIQAGK